MKILIVAAGAALSHGHLYAETVADLVLEDRVFDAAVDGIIREFNCAVPRQSIEALTNVYESVERESEPIFWKGVLARFSCAGVSVELTYSWRDGEEPFGDYVRNFGRAEVKPNDLSNLLSRWADVGSPPDATVTLARNAMVSEILEALVETSEGRCASVRWTISENDAAIVRDPSGVPSQPARGSLNCGRDPSVPACVTNYSLSGNYYPRKALFFLERIERAQYCE